MVEADKLTYITYFPATDETVWLRYDPKIKHYIIIAKLNGNHIMKHTSPMGIQGKE
jgi:hypothetical protein